ncbi:MAG: DNA-3-methyladenine glycosylase I [Acidibacillus sp.]|uniref:DNA-3-methyladenine glycosylase I n=1 Tax=Sulfoacidibacillus ferrooxidans TaxID=2005001 RepID=A0A9X1VAQ7_9BACL|nr:DNA-3-methyladenine glycosylase 1 [Sulfoacidibacillus ferrooxidans]MCY0892726.1 DNA-3-methyladenine glycosylase I [Acidibacillus sp.]
MISRCAYVTSDPLYIKYHDTEWGVPVYDDRTFFEFLILEGAQAGLSFYTILKKRDHFRSAFDSFNPQKVAIYDEDRLAILMQDKGIIRNRLKLQSAINNAKAYLAIQATYGSFSSFIWGFVDGQPVINEWKTKEEVPVNTPLSDRMSKELKLKGFTFVGSTICYSFMQATGMIMDHTTDCFRYAELSAQHHKLAHDGR